MASHDSSTPARLEVNRENFHTTPQKICGVFIFSGLLIPFQYENTFLERKWFACGASQRQLELAHDRSAGYFLFAGNKSDG